MTFKFINSIATRDAIHEELTELATQAIIGEMEDAPDQQVYGLTRDQMARMHASYEMRHDSDSDYPVQPEERSIEGAQRASKYPPESTSDFLPDPHTPIDNETQERPAGLMAYDLEIDVCPAYTDDKDYFDDDWTGEDNIFEESIEGNSVLLADTITYAIHTGHNIEVILDDGNSVYLDTAALNMIKQSSKFDKIKHFTSNITEFSDFLKEIYGPAAGEIHEEPDYIETEAQTDSIGESVLSQLNKVAAKAMEEALAEAYNPNKKTYGKVDVVNRIKGGKVQLRKKTSNTKGYKIENGNLVRMSPTEMRNRRRAARISSRKRKQEMARILRNRRISMQRRKMRLGV